MNLAKSLVNTLKRTCLWIGSLFLSVTFFSLLFGLLQSNLSTAPVIFRVTMLLALPVWCLYLPFVILIKDAEQQRSWVLLVSGILIGPATIACVALVSQLRGGDVETIWKGDPLTGLGAGSGMIYGAVVGFITTVIIYVIALKTFTRRSAATGLS
jgi:hypothetical protein